MKRTPSIFLVHSKSNQWHRTFYEDIKRCEREIEARLINYIDWSWTTPRGVSTSAYTHQLQRHLSTGMYDIEGVGEVRLTSDTVPAHFLPGGYFSPQPMRLNRHDLERLVTKATVVVLAEDNDDSLTLGMSEELSIVRRHRLKKINVRFVSTFNHLRPRSVFEFVPSEDSDVGHTAPSDNNFTNRLTVWVRKNEDTRLFDESSAAVAKLAIAIACEDDWYGGDWGARKG